MEAMGFAMEGVMEAMSGAEPCTGSPCERVPTLASTRDEEATRTDHDEVVARVDGGYESERTNQRRTRVTNDITIQIRTHEDVQPLGRADEVIDQTVDYPLVHLDGRVAVGGREGGADGFAEEAVCH